MKITGMGMNNLNIHDIPDDLYKRLQQLARTKHRSLNSLVIDILSKAFDVEERRSEQANILKSIRNKRFKKPANAPATLNLRSLGVAVIYRQM
jgi:plasmid stability protein